MKIIKIVNKIAKWNLNQQNKNEKRKKENALPINYELIKHRFHIL